MKNNHPCTFTDYGPDVRLIDNNPQKQLVLDWIDENIWGRVKPLYSTTSYGLKHTLQQDTGIYVSNNEFKDAMLAAGFKPANPKAEYWNFCISKKSPCFDWKSRQYGGSRHQDWENQAAKERGTMKKETLKKEKYQERITYKKGLGVASIWDDFCFEIVDKILKDELQTYGFQKLKNDTFVRLPEDCERERILEVHVEVPDGAYLTLYVDQEEEETVQKGIERLEQKAYAELKRVCQEYLQGVLKLAEREEEEE